MSRLFPPKKHYEAEHTWLNTWQTAPKPDSAHLLYYPCLDILMNERFSTIASVVGVRVSSSNLKCLLTRIAAAAATCLYSAQSGATRWPQNRKLRKYENGLNCNKNHDEDNFPLQHFSVGTEAP